MESWGRGCLKISHESLRVKSRARPQGSTLALTLPGPREFPSPHPPRVPGPSRNSPRAGIPRAPRLAARPASERDTCGAPPGEEGVDGRFPCVCAVTSARRVWAVSEFALPRLTLAPPEPGLGRVRVEGPDFLGGRDQASGN